MPVEAFPRALSPSPSPSPSASISGSREDEFLVRLMRLAGEELVSERRRDCVVLNAVRRGAPSQEHSTMAKMASSRGSGPIAARLPHAASKRI
jgi:hypothetical protein